MYIHVYTQTLTYMMLIRELVTKSSNKLLGLDNMNECVWIERKQISNKCVLHDSIRSKTMSACVQGWTSLGKSLEGTLQMPSLRYAVFVLLSSNLSSAAASLYKRNNARKQEADWETGSHSRTRDNSISFVKLGSPVVEITWFTYWETNSFCFFVWH